MEDLYPNIDDLLQLDEAADLDDDQAPEQEAEMLEDKIEEENIQPALKLDYKLKTCEERAELVNKIVAQTPQEHLTNRYLEILGDYIIGGITKEERKSHLYMTDNRRITVNRRETSFEGLAEKLENGEDGIYNLINDSKNMLFQPKNEITKEDIETIPGLKELRQSIEQIEEAGKKAVGKEKFLLKKWLIDLRKDQYVLKSSFRAPMYIVGSGKGNHKIDLSETKYVDENGEPQSTGLVNLFTPEHISAILCHYPGLKLETKGKYWDDFYYLLEDFDKLITKALANYPMYVDIVRMKIQGAQNTDIQQMLENKYSEKHSSQYISSLWRNRIPKIIAECAKDDFLIWYYEHEKKGPMKRCACCGQRKPANSHFFSKNKTSKDGWYSWCKECRKIKNKGKN